MDGCHVQQFMKEHFSRITFCYHENHLSLKHVDLFVISTPLHFLLLSPSRSNLPLYYSSSLISARSWVSRSGWGWRAPEVRASRIGRRHQWTTGALRWLTLAQRAPVPPRFRRAGASTTARGSDRRSASRVSPAPPLMVRVPFCFHCRYFISVWIINKAKSPVLESGFWPPPCWLFSGGL